jgi:coiled-coil domain-containing protein 12
MSNKIGSLETEALRRKERLKALKRGDLKSVPSEQLEQNTENDILNELPKPIFRNYTPKDDQLKPGVLPKPNLIEIENAIKDQLASGKPEPLIEKEIDLTTLAPQKIDWDLKRDVEKKLRLLEKRTQRAIVDLIKERLKKQKNTDFAELVSVGSKQENKQKEEDEEDDENNNTDDDDDDDDESDNEQSYSSVEINNKREISDDDEY